MECLRDSEQVSEHSFHFKFQMCHIKQTKHQIINFFLLLFTFFQEKYEEENENSSEKINNNNNETTIVATTGNATQPQQIFHVSVEYEEPKPKVIKSEITQNARKRRLITKDGIEVTQHQIINQFAPATSTPKQMPTIIIDDKSQDGEAKVQESEEPQAKVLRNEDAKNFDQFEIFGLFVANEMRSLKNPSLQKKLKRKILECVLEINDQDSDHHA